jgi:hypothetical protein
MPTITGSWTTLPQADFDAPHPNGGFLHFRPRGVTELDPFTKIDTGQSAREIIAALAAAHGWPLIGIFVSGSGESTPHLAIHRSDFPTETGNPEQRAEKLQNALDAAMENIYKDEFILDDPDDPDDGQTITARNFWVNTRINTYRNDGLYQPRTDYQFRVGNSQPTGQWWLTGE